MPAGRCDGTPSSRSRREAVVGGKDFKNIQVLKGISRTQFMATMGFISASLGETCHLERQVMEILWECGACNVHDVVSGHGHYQAEAPEMIGLRG